MAAVAGLGAVMSSTAVVAIFIPVVLRISPEHRHGAGPADDAAELRRADQRHADPGRDRTEPGGQRRAGPPGRGGLSFLQRHAVRRAGAGPRHPLHAVRAALAGARRPTRALRDVGGRACATGSSSTSSPNAAIASACPRTRRSSASAWTSWHCARPGSTCSRSSAAIAPGRGSSARRRRPSSRPATSCSSTCACRTSRSRRCGEKHGARAPAARGGRPVPDRPRAGARHGRGHRPGRIEAGRPDRARGAGPARLRPDGDRPAPRPVGARSRPRSRRSCKSATPCSWSASGRTSSGSRAKAATIWSCSPPPAELDEVLPAPEQGAPGARRPGAGRRADDQRRHRRTCRPR